MEWDHKPKPKPVDVMGMLKRNSRGISLQQRLMECFLDLAALFAQHCKDIGIPWFMKDVLQFLAKARPQYRELLQFFVWRSAPATQPAWLPSDDAPATTNLAQVWHQQFIEAISNEAIVPYPSELRELLQNSLNIHFTTAAMALPVTVNNQEANSKQLSEYLRALLPFLAPFWQEEPPEIMASTFASEILAIINDEEAAAPAPRQFPRAVLLRNFMQHIWWLHRATQTRTPEQFLVAAHEAPPLDEAIQKDLLGIVASSSSSSPYWQQHGWLLVALLRFPHHEGTRSFLQFFARATALQVLDNDTATSREYCVLVANMLQTPLDGMEEALFRSARTRLAGMLDVEANRLPQALLQNVLEKAWRALFQYAPGAVTRASFVKQVVGEGLEVQIPAYGDMERLTDDMAWSENDLKREIIDGMLHDQMYHVFLQLLWATLQDGASIQKNGLWAAIMRQLQTQSRLQSRAAVVSALRVLGSNLTPEGITDDDEVESDDAAIQGYFQYLANPSEDQVRESVIDVIDSIRRVNAREGVAWAHQQLNLAHWRIRAPEPRDVLLPPLDQAIREQDSGLVSDPLRTVWMRKSLPALQEDFFQLTSTRQWALLCVCVKGLLDRGLLSDEVFQAITITDASITLTTEESFKVFYGSLIEPFLRKTFLDNPSWHAYLRNITGGGATDSAYRSRYCYLLYVDGVETPADFVDLVKPIRDDSKIRGFSKALVTANAKLVAAAARRDDDRR